jgi:hypothetical protein
MCSGGGTYSGDTHMWLYNNSGSYITENDDYCSLGSQITWVATYTGTLYLRVASHNSNAASWTLAWTYTIPCNPPTSITPTASSTSVCTGTPVTFGGSISGGACPSGVYYYQWRDPYGSVIRSYNTTIGMTYTPTTTGYYYLDVYCNDCSGSTNTGSIYITVNTTPSAPTPSATPSDICSGESSTLSASVSGSTIYWYSGSCGGTLLGTGNSISVSPSSTTTYYARSYTGSCWSTSCGSVTVNVGTAPDAPTGTGDAVCSGQSATLTASGSTGDYSWWTASSGGTNLGCGSSYTTPVLYSTTTYYVQAEPAGGTGGTLLYSQPFVNGVTPTTSALEWCSFRSSLTSDYDYQTMTIRGTYNMTGITLTNPTHVAAIANALRTATSYSCTSDGYTWYVSTGCGSSPCGGTSVELHVDVAGCSCSGSYTIRPEINNENWGGVGGTTTCGAPSQTMEVLFTYGSGGGGSTSYPNGAGGTFTYNPGDTPQTIALKACESHYGVGACITGSCGYFSYYYSSSSLSCNCDKPIGQYEWIYSNTGYTQVGQDYGGATTDVTGNGLFVRVKSSATCNSSSWTLALEHLGTGGGGTPSSSQTFDYTGSYQTLLCRLVLPV